MKLTKGRGVFPLPSMDRMISSVMTILQQRYDIFLPFMQCTTMTFTLFAFQNLSTARVNRVRDNESQLYIEIHMRCVEKYCISPYRLFHGLRLWAK
jgi:hypothetical protein